MSRRRFRVVFRERPSEVFLASGYEERDEILEFFDADIADDETTGTRVFARSSVIEVVELDT
jgi:hypothetical protein